MKAKSLFLFTATLSLISLITPSHATVIFEREFVRGTGAPVTDSYTFYSEFGGAATAELCNGGAVDDSDEKVSSSEVYINGELIFSANNFNQNVGCLDAYVVHSVSCVFTRQANPTRPGTQPRSASWATGATRPK